MRVQLALAAVTLAMLHGMPPVTDPDLTPPQRLKIAEWLFGEGVKAAGDSVASRQSFHMAAIEYQKLTDQGFDDPDLFLNLGKAHFLADELPEAIVAFRRGLLKHPLHAELWQYLASARDHRRSGRRRRPGLHGEPPSRGPGRPLDAEPDG